MNFSHKHKNTVVALECLDLGARDGETGEGAADGAVKLLLDLVSSKTAAV